MSHQVLAELSRSSSKGCDRQDGTEGNSIRRLADDPCGQTVYYVQLLMNGLDEIVQATNSSLHGAWERAHARRLVSTPDVDCLSVMRQCLAPSDERFDDLISSTVNAKIKEGHQTFFSHLFDDEGFWAGTLTFH